MQSSLVHLVARVFYAFTLACVLFPGQFYAQSVLKISVAAGTDDMEEYVTGANIGGFDVGSSDLEMTTEGGGRQIIGLRFNGIAIPQGAIITNAYIQFRADESHTEPTNLVIKAQDADNPGTFTTADKISTRTTVKDSVKWDNIPAWVTGDAGAAQKTPSLAGLVSAVLSRNSWASGNSLVFIVSGAGKRVADSFDDTEAARKAAELVIEYIAPIRASASIANATDDMEEYVTGANTGGFDVGSSDLEMTTEGGGRQIIGLRFALKAPKGALIKRAYIQFRADESHTEATTLVLKVQAADNPGTFTTTDKISTRPLLADSAKWENIPAWTTGDAGAAQRTPDLSALVQATVNRSGWADGNAIVFVLSGTGKRVADAFDDTEAARKAAELVVEFLRPVELKIPIADATDDMEEYVTGANIGGFDVGSSDLEMTTEGGGRQIIGLRFKDVKLPKGAMIASASIQFRADESHSEPTNLVVKAQAADNPGTFTTTDKISTRPVLVDSVKWENIPAWTTGDAGAAQRTPDLKTLAQTLVNREGWSSGNSMTFVISGTGKRVADAIDDTEAAKKQAELSVVYFAGDGAGGPKAVYPIGAFPVSRSTDWKYNDTGVKYTNADWAARKFVADTAWAFARGKLGYNLSGLSKELSFGANAAQKHITTYFRNTFRATDLSVFDSLVFYALVNDGAVVYINGQEVQRVNMPAGAVDAETLAASNVSGAGLTQYRRFVVKNTLLPNDTNTVAVELHLHAANASDMVFDLEIVGKRPKAPNGGFPIPRNSQWSAFDQGREPAGDWKALNYEDRSWMHGPGVLGYGDPVATLLSFGDDPANKYPTTYFRKVFEIKNLGDLNDTLELQMRRDDGAVLYINGKEALRSNMPAGPVAYTTYATSSVGGTEETTYFTFNVLKTAFVQGLNVIAVEVHQDDAVSSDVTFDLALKNKHKPNEPGLGCNGAADAHISCFRSVLPESKNLLLNIPASHRMQVLAQTGDAYPNGTGNYRSSFDFTGFIPDNSTSSVKGHVALNYETVPGGVSLSDVSYNATTKLWRVDTAKAVDFTGVAGTVANCSGTVTPWGTSITCEETRLGADTDGDGYIDFGWCTEIDPTTSKVRDYGTGKPQKLWALGRGSHENVVIRKDSITLYWGEDAGDGHVYKFIADKKADLSSGKLYVLKLEAQLVSNEPVTNKGVWVQVPNTTKEERNNTFSIAKGLGATLFNGVEDIEISPKDDLVYFAVKNNSRIYRFKDAGNAITDFETFVGGDSYFVNSGAKAVLEPWGTGNDNLTFDDRGNLWVLQDGSQDHIWVVRPDHSVARPKIELFATTPAGCEPTGMTFTPDHKFMFISMQEPSSTNTATQKDAAGKTVTFNRSSMLVIARAENLGTMVGADEKLLPVTALKLYPNPTGGDLTIEYVLQENGPVQVSVFNLSGQLIEVNDAEGTSGENTFQLQLNQAGVHFVKVATREGSRLAKVVVVK